jgi:hypothetical protein
MQNYGIILKELTTICSNITSLNQIKRSKLSNLELVALNLTVEYMSYNSELHLFRALKGAYFQGKIECFRETLNDNAPMIAFFDYFCISICFLFLRS